MKQSEILHESRLDEEANTNPRTRIVGMKWVELGKGKDPEFMQQVFLYRKPDENNAAFCVGYLTSITVEQDRKIYKFDISDELDDRLPFTHYAIPQPPKV